MLLFNDIKKSFGDLYFINDMFPEEIIYASEDKILSFV